MIEMMQTLNLKLYLQKFYAWLSSNKFWISATWIREKYNNVYKTKRKETICYILQTLVRRKWRQVVLSRKPVYYGISKFILWFPYSSHILCTKLLTMYFQIIHSMFSFLFYWSHLRVGTLPPSNSSLFR